MTDLRSLDREELTKFILDIGEKRFRADQIYSWIHKKLARSTEEMTDLPKKLRESLDRDTYLSPLEIVDVKTSEIDGTKKYLFRLSDGNLIESVWMKYREWRSVCISTQVGCRMGCRFCASTMGGWIRNLTPGEMLDQVYSIQKETGERVSNIVVMGSGEPLDNYDALLKFIRMISDENGLNIGERHITVSTCGIVEKVRMLAEEKLQISLALSLHAADDEKRKTIMPIAEKYSISEIMDAAAYYFHKTGRRVTVEYALSRNVNDSDRDIENLTALIRPLKAHVNLIPVNPVEGREFAAVSREQAAEFKSKLEKNGINVTIRREMGRDIEGACGQLRRRYLEG